MTKKKKEQPPVKAEKKVSKLINMTETMMLDCRICAHMLNFNDSSNWIKSLIQDGIDKAKSAFPNTYNQLLSISQKEGVEK